VLVCTTGNRCVDKPAEFLKTVILPPDPLPLKNPRVPDFAYEQQTVRIIQFATVPGNQPPWGAGPEMDRAVQYLEDDQGRVIQYLTQTGHAQSPPYGPIPGPQGPIDD
jgi:hypothetical protein